MPGLQLLGFWIGFVLFGFQLDLWLRAVADDPPAGAPAAPHPGYGEAFDQFYVMLHRTDVCTEVDLFTRRSTDVLASSVLR
jgi:hypothetical protein